MNLKFTIFASPLFFFVLPAASCFPFMTLAIPIARSDYSAIMHRMHGARTGQFRFLMAISVHTARSERTLLLLSSDMDVQYFQRSTVAATFFYVPLALQLDTLDNCCFHIDQFQ